MSVKPVHLSFCFGGSKDSLLPPKVSVPLNIAREKLPSWANNQPENLKKYYSCFKPKILERLVCWIASCKGNVIHGNLTNQQLKANLDKFDIHRLILTGPYENKFLPIEAQKLLRNSLLPLEKVVDPHFHVVSVDKGNYFNPEIANQSRLKFFCIARAASGISYLPERSTALAQERLSLYAKHFPKLEGGILPIHEARLSDGTVDWSKTASYLNNHTAINTAKNFTSAASKLYPATSIHPSDPKWEQKLLKAYEQGIRLVKWMPPQGIQPDAPQLNKFYEALAKHKMILLAHSGPEHAFPSDGEWQDWGNPLRFRNALQKGVTVVLAHCGHQDLIPDLDDPEGANVPGHKLFARLAKEAHEKKWPGKLFGDLSGTTHYGPEFLSKLLKYTNKPGVRILYGSDYPYTNLMKDDPYVVFSKFGLLKKEYIEPLRKIREWNPLVANFVFISNLSKVDSKGNSITFPKSTYTGKFNDVIFEPYQFGPSTHEVASRFTNIFKRK